jgi:ABC-type Fe3+/spermidine/putrescine transport system ATPase subunit
MLRLEGLTKRFGETTAVSGLSLEVERGEFLSLLGPSGCGKTTTLRMIAGFEAPDAGRIMLADRDVTGLPPQRRGMGMVFQSYALFPHLDVYGNVEFGLRSQGVASSEIADRVGRALELVALDGLARRRVQALSGGQQQRVALARALAPEPPVLLLDEPLSNLDAALRERTRVELRSLLKQVGITAVFVTHDQEEAFDLSDRIAVLNAGELQQVGTPEELYGAPANEFVGSFVGRASFLPGRLVGVSGAAGSCEVAGSGRWSVRVAPGAVEGSEVTVMARPESLLLLAMGEGDRPESGGAQAVRGRVAERRFAGPVTMYRVEIEGGGEVLISSGARVAAVGQAVAVTLAPGAVAHAFSGSARARPAAPGTRAGPTQ